ncbi:AgmX/PglI C-terminal domain-containing protein [Kaarinaea lacus]
MSAAVAQEESILEQIDRCQLQINQCEAEIRKYEAELKAANQELENISDERQKYEILSNISENLEKLNEVGGNELFWTGLAAESEVENHLSQLREKAEFFNRRIKKFTDRRDAAISEIKSRQNDIGFLLDDIEYLEHRQEEAQFEYIVEREIKPLPYQVVVMPWTKQGKDEKKYRKILLLALLLSILFGLVIPMYDVPIPDRAEVVKIPERLAKLVKKQQPKPKPKKKKLDETKQEKKEPTKKERKEAREKVKTKGVLAFKNNFADLLDDASLDKLGANANLSNAGSTAKRTQRSIITTAATSASGGISSSSLSRNTAGTGDDLAAVGFSRVESDIGIGAGEDRPLSDGPGPSRTDEEIQIVFDKYKAALYRIYNRELRSNPTLQGKVVLRITIEPDGSVSLAKVESTDMEAQKMLAKIVERVKRFNFGAKEGVPPTTILYPIDFLPAS